MSPALPLTFVTGTDTGVGKTVATAWLVYHLRQSGVNAAGLKPFCSGGREDAEVLRRIQGPVLSLDEVNPFHFRDPVAPLVAARKEGRTIVLDQALEAIRKVIPKCQQVIVEGCGGWLTPLGKNFSLPELVEALEGRIVVVAPNKLGVINQVLLTLNALPKARKNGAKVLLMEPEKRDPSGATNMDILGEIIAPSELFLLPFLGYNPLEPRGLQEKYKKIKKTLAALNG